MVRAEIPLWVAHSSVSPTTTGSATTAPKDENVERAAESLALLEGLGGTQKCAIYSIDMHPNGQKFATGGGDGTVRLWNAGALFQSTRKKGSSKYEGGHFVSSGESSVGEDEDEDSAASGNGMASVEGDKNNNSSSASSSDEEDVIHDLSSLVRRKKDAAASSPTKKQPSTNTPTTPAHHQKHGAAHHRLLCTLSAHTGSSVLAVRFSTDGQYLASAGDDAIVCIYAQVKSNGNLDQQHHSVEHWARIKLCRGHALDAVGLAWAPDDSHLVSCSLDSNTPIIVWKLTDLANNQRPTHSNVLCNPYKVLGKGIHTSTVKGVTFDPAGTYLASSGDDPSICIWRAHDDWGLEKRVDASSGIFRRWEGNESQTLSSQSLFRRLSWSTDGAYICSTNAVVKNKHVASTISREGWAVSSPKTTASGAANLVGHKQPVVACRHCPLLLDARQDKGVDGDGDEEPEYATLLALGDKRGFVTVWSTRRSRPIFKIQCSETRCTVTDLAWGRVQNRSDMMLLVSLLDGQVVALRFDVPDELGTILKPEEQARVFQLRYGIDLNDVSAMGGRRLFVGENSGPKLIENALQFTLEDGDDEDDDGDNLVNEDSSEGGQATNKNLSSSELKANQLETRVKGGKKRIQPFLMQGERSPKKAKPDNGSNTGEKTAKKKVDTLEDAIQLAEKAASGAEAAANQKPTNKAPPEAGGETPAAGHRELLVSSPSQHQHAHLVAGAQASTPQIPHSTDRIHSIDLPVVDDDSTSSEVGAKFVADCTNSIQIPQGSSGSALPCTVLSISRAGQSMWKDQLPGSSCSTIAASKKLLAIGTSDGCVQLYGTSPSLGWKSGVAFRSHPPFVLGRPIVALQLHDVPAPDHEGAPSKTEMLVVSADGTFGVYSVVPELKIRFKGTIMPPMTHMLLSSDMSTEIHLPRLARIQLTDTGRLLLLLSLHSNQGRTSNEENRGRGNSAPSVGAGGSLQAFVYSEMSELWMRVADSRFILSHFYSTLPTLSKSKKAAKGELGKLDDSVRMGAISSSLKTSRRGRAYIGGNADAAYNQTRDDASNDVATRSHCEDRMACAVALGSPSEFEYWLSMYVRTLAMSGDESLLRVVVDMLSGSNGKDGMEVQGVEKTLCWWLSEAPCVLTLDRTKLIKSIVIPEMSKNRALQRITNEIAVDLGALN